MGTLSKAKTEDKQRNASEAVRLPLCSIHLIVIDWMVFFFVIGAEKGNVGEEITC